MPSEEETTAVTVPVTTPDSSIMKTQANAEMSPMVDPTEKTLGKSPQITENKETHQEEKKHEAMQEASKSKEEENKENMQQNISKVENATTDPVETKGKAEATGQTEGIGLRKRRTPDKKESKEDDVSPPKKVK